MDKIKELLLYTAIILGLLYVGAHIQYHRGIVFTGSILSTNLTK